MTVTNFYNWLKGTVPTIPCSDAEFYQRLRHAYEDGEASQVKTRRDEFAGQALPGVMATCQGDTRLLNETTPEMFARKSYEVADAMLEARKTTGEGEA